MRSQVAGLGAGLNLNGSSRAVSNTAVSTSNTAPGPRGSRWLGMAPELQRDQLGTYERLVAEYGDVVRLVVGPPGLRRELYLVTHPDGVQQVLAGDPDGYSKNTPYYDEIAAYLGEPSVPVGKPLS